MKFIDGSCPKKIPTDTGETPVVDVRSLFPWYIRKEEDDSSSNFRLETRGTEREVLSGESPK